MDSHVRTEITIETHEVMVIRRQGSYPKSFCPQCGDHATMLTPDEATTIFRFSTRQLIRLVEEGKLHFVETPKGTLLLCPESLLAISSSQQPLLVESSDIEVAM